MKTTQPFDCYNFPFPNFLHSFFKGGCMGIKNISLFIPKLKRRTALRTSIWFGMKSPIKGIFIFCLACVTHFKLFHAGIDAIVWQRFHNRKTGTAICTIRKWILITPILWIPNIP